jgi:uncharacterized protein YdbL (DUF1318 family)
MNKEFRIDEVFVMKRGKEAAPNRVPDGSYNMVNETSTNNGITKKAYSENVFDGNSITVSVNYATTVFYQPEPYCASVNILILENDNLDAESAMYVVAMLRKNNEKYDYNNKISKGRLAETVLPYPVIVHPDADHEYTVDDIDWQYMHDYITELEHEHITELEQERITELDAYLQATGLNDYELTEDDKKILSLSTERTSDEDGTLEDDSEDEVRFGEFDITKIFTVKNTKCIMQKQIVPNSGDIPYVTAGDSNNAVSTYIDCPIEWTDVGNCVFIGGKTLVITYQEKDFCSNDSHNLALYLNNEEYRNGYVYRYMVGALKSALSHKYYWGDSISRKKIQNDKMLLPIKSDGTPDFDYMERYIRAIEKVVIADVVKYKDKVIEETRKVVGA